jgi:hypothetical protein
MAEAESSDEDEWEEVEGEAEEDVEGEDPESVGDDDHVRCVTYCPSLPVSHSH